jgi:tetratricopeptide (TPR) repeat protein
MSSWLADYEAWMALEESEKHRLISDANDARLTVEATQEVMHVMALEQYNELLVVQVNWHARQVIRRGEVEQALFFIRRGEVDQANLDLDEAILDLDEANLDVANTYYKIADVNMTLRKYELAGFNFRACVDIQIKVLGANNVDVANTYNTIACLYHMQKKYELALETYGKCLAIRIAVLGENHVDVLCTKIKMGEVRIFQEWNLSLQFGGLP